MKISILQVLQMTSTSSLQNRCKFEMFQMDSCVDDILHLFMTNLGDHTFKTSDGTGGGGLVGCPMLSDEKNRWRGGVGSMFRRRVQKIKKLVTRELFISKSQYSKNVIQHTHTHTLNDSCHGWNTQTHIFTYKISICKPM